jgi:hypothetical protein
MPSKGKPLRRPRHRLNRKISWSFSHRCGVQFTDEEVDTLFSRNRSTARPYD